MMNFFRFSAQGHSSWPRAARPLTCAHVNVVVEVGVPVGGDRMRYDMCPPICVSMPIAGLLRADCRSVVMC